MKQEMKGLVESEKIREETEKEWIDKTRMAKT